MRVQASLVDAARIHYRCSAPTYQVSTAHWACMLSCMRHCFSCFMLGRCDCNPRSWCFSVQLLCFQRLLLCCMLCRGVLALFRYETTNHLWLILEYCVGGDLMSLLRQDVRLPESSIHDFGRDMVVALQVGQRAAASAVKWPYVTGC